MKKILLVNDSDTYTWCLQKYLQHRGYAYRQLSGEPVPTFHKRLFVHAEDLSAGVLQAAMLQKGFDLTLVSSIADAKH